ncbi:MAG: hypothetical protein H8Z69_00080 [Nanohaloarchaea archaeon]|nr:hypothetical protein [Candidatus Nanohaloarchaea archaeon]
MERRSEDGSLGLDELDFINPSLTEEALEVVANDLESNNQIFEDLKGMKHAELQKGWKYYREALYRGIRERSK